MSLGRLSTELINFKEEMQLLEEGNRTFLEVIQTTIILVQEALHLTQGTHLEQRKHQLQDLLVNFLATCAEQELPETLQAGQQHGNRLLQVQATVNSLALITEFHQTGLDLAQILECHHLGTKESKAQDTATQRIKLLLAGKSTTTRKLWKATASIQLVAWVVVEGQILEITDNSKIRKKSTNHRSGTLQTRARKTEVQFMTDCTKTKATRLSVKRLVELVCTRKTNFRVKLSPKPKLKESKSCKLTKRTERRNKSQRLK